MVQTVQKKSTNFKPAPGSARPKRYKIGKAPPQNFTPKETSPGVRSIKMPEVVPSRPSVKERMGVGGRKGKAKGRTDPKAANPKDPGAYPMPSTKVHYLTPDKFARKGYVKGKGWPESSTGMGKNPKLSNPKPTRS